MLPLFASANGKAPSQGSQKTCLSTFGSSLSGEKPWSLLRGSCPHVCLRLKFSEGIVVFQYLYRIMKAVLRCLFLFLFAGFRLLPAQVNPQVIIANGGVFGPTNMVKVGAYNINAHTYMDFDSFPASSVQDVLIDEQFAYVLADSMLVQYDIPSHQRVHQEVIYGLRKAAIFNNGFLKGLLVTKGFGSNGDYVEMRNLMDLSPWYTVPNISGECEGIIAVGDSAYVAVPSFFGAPFGKLAVLDLNTRTVQREIDLDTNGRIIGKIYAEGGKFYTINQIAYTGNYGVITEYNPANGWVTNYRVDLPTSQGAGVYQNKLYANFGGGIGGFDLSTGLLADTNIVPGYWAGMVMSEINGDFYVTESDYATYGKLRSFDHFGNLLDTVAIGISPEALAIHYDIITQNADVRDNENLLKAYPQPFGNELNVDLGKFHAFAGKLTLSDLLGRIVMTQEIQGNGIQTLETAQLAPGTYVLKAQSRTTTATLKVMKVGN
jgi:hypothetical protein